MIVDLAAYGRRHKYAAGDSIERHSCFVTFRSSAPAGRAFHEYEVRFYARAGHNRHSIRRRGVCSIFARFAWRRARFALVRKDLPTPAAASLIRHHRKRTSARQHTTILRQFARTLAEIANASERKVWLEKPDATRKMGYFLRFVRTVGFERRLLRM